MVGAGLLILLLQVGSLKAFDEVPASDLVISVLIGCPMLWVVGLVAFAETKDQQGMIKTLEWVGI